jgi:hypothetical protein
MSKHDRIHIPANHRRSLSVTAHHIENSIDELEELLNNKRQNKITEKIIKNVDSDERDEILNLINKVRKQNEEMFYALDLSSNEVYEDRILRSRIGHIWTLLCDSTPQSLKGYGETNEQQSELITRHVNNLLKTINEIQSIIFKESQDLI